MTRAAMAAAYNEVAASYDQHFNNNFDRAEEDYLFGYMRPFLEDRRVCDLGSGTGLLLDLCARHRVTLQEYVGVDIADRMIAQGRLKHPMASFVCCDMTRFLEICPVRYEAITALYMPFNYVQDPARALERVVHRLQPGGTFLNVVVSPRYRQREHYILQGQDALRHVYTAGELAQMTLDAGLSILDMVACNVRLEPYRKGLERWPVWTNKFLFHLDALIWNNSARDAYLYLCIARKAS